MKEKFTKIKDLLISNSKIVFPVLLIIVVAVTVSLALGAFSRKDEIEQFAQKADQESALEQESEMVETQVETETGETQEEEIIPDVPLERDANPAVNTLIYTYYDALANGNADTIASISNVLDDMGRIKVQELGNYIEWYPVVEIYSKPGPEENSYIVFAYTKAKFNGYEEEVAGFQTFYVCTDAEGNVYLNEDEISQEHIEYIYAVNYQDDVVELYNKATVEYNETMLANTELFEYIAAMESDIREATGLIIAEQIANEQAGAQEGTGETDGGSQNGQQGSTGTQVTGPVYAYATATVNVRKSDSTTADKLGKVTEGEKIKVLEKKANGWSKVEYNGKEGYIKSEYLQTQESADGAEMIGVVTAKTNLNIRSKASQTSEKLGVLAGGESLELIAVEGDWCKVVYKGKVAYVKAEFVVQHEGVEEPQD